MLDSMATSRLRRTRFERLFSNLHPRQIGKNRSAAGGC
jgi:hypothetical protein